MTSKSETKPTWHHVDRLVEAPKVLAFALYAHAELRRDGLTNVISLTGQEQAFYAMNSISKEPCGIISYYLCEDEPCIQVELAYINKFQRREGIFSTLIEMLRATAREQNLSISIGTHVTNKRMRDVLRRLGASEQYVVLDLPVKP